MCWYLSLVLFSFPGSTSMSDIVPVPKRASSKVAVSLVVFQFSWLLPLYILSIRCIYVVYHPVWQHGSEVPDILSHLGGSWAGFPRRSSIPRQLKREEAALPRLAWPALPLPLRKAPPACFASTLKPTGQLQMDRSMQVTTYSCLILGTCGV